MAPRLLNCFLFALQCEKSYFYKQLNRLKKPRASYTATMNSLTKNSKYITMGFCMAFAITLCLGDQTRAQNPSQPSHYHTHYKYAFQSINIPLVDFDEVSLREALDILALKIEHETNKKIVPNFIIHDLKGAFKNRNITLRLKNVPASALLGYIVNMVRGSVRYDKYAIVVSPLGASR